MMANSWRSIAAAELAGPRHPERVLGPVQVEARDLDQLARGRRAPGTAGRRTRVTSWPSSAQLPGEVAGVDALPAAVRVAPVDEEGDPEGLIGRRDGKGRRQKWHGRGDPTGRRARPSCEAQCPWGTAPVQRVHTCRSAPRWWPARATSPSPGGRPVATGSGGSRRSRVVPTSWSAPADRSAAPAIVTADVGVTPAASYGGGAWCWVGDDRVAYVTADGALTVLDLAGGAPVTIGADGRAAAPAVTPDGSRVAFVLDRDDACDIAVVPARRRRAGRCPCRSADYAWDPAWSPDGARLAWHEWDLPDMPWDGSRIVVADGDGGGASVVAGGDDIAVGQPRFSPDGVASRSCPTNGLVERLGHRSGRRPGRGSRRPLLDEPHEHAEPTWGPGQRSFAWSPDGRAIASCRNEDGFGRLVVVTGGGADAVSKGWHHGLDWGPAGIVCVRSARAHRRTVTRSHPARVPSRGGSRPGRRVRGRRAWSSRSRSRGPATTAPTVHGLLYRPSRTRWPATGSRRCWWTCTAGRPARRPCRGTPACSTSPRAAGPSSHRTTAARPGTAARTRRRSPAAGASSTSPTPPPASVPPRRAVVRPRRVAVMGGSAGGLTVLLLAAHHGELLRAGVSVYGVTDLFELAATTHRFESRYLDRLVGTLPGHAGALPGALAGHARARPSRVPLLVLQGDDDTRRAGRAGAHARRRCARRGRHRRARRVRGRGPRVGEAGDRGRRARTDRAFLDRWVVTA